MLRLKWQMLARDPPKIGRRRGKGALQNGRLKKSTSNLKKTSRTTKESKNSAVLVRTVKKITILGSLKSSQVEIRTYPSETTLRLPAFVHGLNFSRSSVCAYVAGGLRYSPAVQEGKGKQIQHLNVNLVKTTQLGARFFPTPTWQEPCWTSTQTPRPKWFKWVADSTDPAETRERPLKSFGKKSKCLLNKQIKLKI